MVSSGPLTGNLLNINRSALIIQLGAPPPTPSPVLSERARVHGSGVRQPFNGSLALVYKLLKVDRTSQQLVVIGCVVDCCNIARLDHCADTFAGRQRNQTMDHILVKQAKI